MSIGQRMKKIRENQNITIKEISTKTNIPISTYRDWENGCKIKGEPYVKIAQSLNVSLYELITGEKAKLLKVYTEIEEIERACQNLKKHVQSFI